MFLNDPAFNGEFDIGVILLQYKIVHVKTKQTLNTEIFVKRKTKNIIYAKGAHKCSLEN